VVGSIKLGGGAGHEELLPIGDDPVDRRPGDIRIDVRDGDQAAVAALEAERVGQRELGRELRQRLFDRGPLGVGLDRKGEEMRSRFDRATVAVTALAEITCIG
jgi:hypothetical protein